MSRSSHVRLERFRKEHVRAMQAGPQAIAELTSIPRWEQALVQFEQHGPGVTIRYDETIIACAGLMIPWPGLGEVWVLASLSALTVHRKSFHQTCLSLLPLASRAHALRRIQAEVMETFAAGRRWAERCGFVYESLMPRFGPNGETFVRYVYFPEEA